MTAQLREKGATKVLRVSLLKHNSQPTSTENIQADLLL